MQALTKIAAVSVVAVGLGVAGCTETQQTMMTGGMIGSVGGAGSIYSKSKEASE